MKNLLEDIRKIIDGSELCENKIQLIKERIKSIEDDIKAHSHTNILLEFSREVSHYQNVEDIISFAVSKISAFLGIEHSLLFFSRCDIEDETLKIKCLVGEEKLKQKLMELFGMENISEKIPITQAQKSAVLSQKLLKLPSLRTLMMNNISQDTAIEWEEKLNVSHFYGYGFSYGTNLLAMFGIISNEEIDSYVFELIETLLNLLNAIIIQKAESEKTISLYNHMTRILDISNCGFGIFNKNGKLLKGNNTFSKLFSVFPEEAINLFHEIFYKEIGLDQNNIDEIKKGYAINLTPENFSSLFENNISNFASGNIVPVISAQNEVEYYILIMKSKTEDNHLLRLMQIHDEKYQRIFQYIQDVYFEINFDGTILEMSPSIERYFNKPREFFIGKNILQFYKNPEDRKDYLAALYKNGEVKNYRIDLKDDNEKVFHCITTASIIDKGKDTERIVGSLTDFNEQHKIYLQIAESESKLRSLFENSPFGVLICDINGEIIDIP